MGGVFRGIYRRHLRGGRLWVSEWAGLTSFPGSGAIGLAQSIGDAEPPHIQFVSVGKLSRLAVGPIDLTPILRSEVLKRRDPVHEQDAGVTAAHQVADQHQIVGWKSAECCDPLRNLELCAIVSGTVNHQVGRPGRRVRGIVRRHRVLSLAQSAPARNPTVQLCLTGLVVFLGVGRGDGSVFAAEPSVSEPKIAEISVGERRPFSWVYLSPAGQVAYASESALLHKVSSLLDGQTDFVVEPMPTGDVDLCLEPESSRRLLCLVQQVESRDAQSLEKQYKLPTEVLLVVSVVPAERGQDSIKAWGIDVAKARTMPAGAGESWLLQNAMLVEGFTRTARDEIDVDLTIEALIQELRSTLLPQGRWLATGNVQLNTPVDGAEIVLDGRNIGATEGGPLRLSGVQAGRRTVRLSHPDFEPFEQAVEVSPGSEPILMAELQQKPSGTAIVANEVLFWSGVATFVAGTAILTVSLVDQGDYAVGCIYPEGGSTEACSTNQFAAPGAPSSPGPNDNPNGTGLPLAPLGYSLMGMGAVWSLGTALFGDDHTFPWVELVSGATAFAASMAISLAANGDNAVCRRNSSGAGC
jgi:hypothetical protein